MTGRAGLEEVARWIREAGRVMALTGAGISTDSGIPDFRGPQGVWTKNPKAERLASIEHYMSDRDVRVAAWNSRLNSPVWRAEPNAGHRALVDLEQRGRLHCLVTQNVDGLHLKAGSSSDSLIEVHGTAHDVVCMSCGERAPMEKALARVRAGEDDPPCRTCEGILKSATISFGQSLVVEHLLRAEREAARADVMLSIGSTLVVYPVAELPAVTLRAGGRLVIMNAEPTAYDYEAHAVFRQPIAEVLPTLVDHV